MHIVWSELKKPLHLSRIRIQRDHGFGVEVIAFAHVAIEIGRWIAGSPVNQVELGIVAAGQPGVAAGRLPGIAGPGFRAGLAGFGDHVPSPEPLAGGGVISVQPAVQPVVARSDSDNDLVSQRQGRDRAPVAVFRLGHFGFPEQIPGARVERDKLRIGSAQVHPVPIDRHAATRSALESRLMMILPDQPSCLRVDGVDLVWLRDVHDPIDHQRHCFQPARAGNVIDPLGHQRLHVSGTDLFQRRMPLGVIRAGVGRPIGWLGAGQILIRQLRLGRAQ